MSTDWLVSMTFVPEFTVQEKELDALADRFDALDWTVALEPDGSVAVTAFLDDDRWSQHLESVLAISRNVLAEVGVKCEVVKAEVMTEERREYEAAQPQLPELVAATDVAKILDVSRQRVNQLYHEHPNFPKPVVTTGAGSLWTRYAIDFFHTSWDRRPGRREPYRINVVVDLHDRHHALRDDSTELDSVPPHERIEA